MGAGGTFSYGINTPPNYAVNPPIDFVRLLTYDTQQFLPDGVTPGYIFSDQEILAMEQIVIQPFQSGQFWSTPNGAIGGGTLGTSLPQIPIPYYRVAGRLIAALANNSARLASVTKLLDVSLNPAAAAKQLMAQAKELLDADDDSGSFMIIEQVNNDCSFRDRFWKQWQRQSAGSF